MANNKDEINQIVGDYKYGFTTDAKTVLTSGKGLNRDVIKFISKAKNEPDWMLEFRLNAYDAFLKLENPKWGPDLSGIDSMNILIILNLQKELNILGKMFLIKLEIHLIS